MDILSEMNKELDDFLNSPPPPPIEHHYNREESFSGRAFVETDKWTNRDKTQSVRITCTSDNILEVYANTTGCDYSHNGQHNAHTEIEIPCKDAFELSVNNGIVRLSFGGNSEINTMADCLYQLACFLRENNSDNGKY